MEEDKGTVCVTGGTGFVASWLIKRLLEHGYSVRTTVRSDPGRKRDLSFLTNLPGASQRLEIYEADLSDPDSFDAAIAGCTGVFHVATPVDFQDKEPERIVTQRAINGTIGILKSCLTSGTVRRVVYTSSTAAVLLGDKGADHVVDESVWSDVEYIRKNRYFGASYSISKTLTERAALEFAEANGLDLVTVLPSVIVGPFICPKFAGSVHSALALILGNREQYGFLVKVPLVHVDDVARAHIFLFECPEARRRYICSSDKLTIHEMAEFLSSRYPQYPIPSGQDLAEVEGQMVPDVSTEKLLSTGFRYKNGITEMFDDAIQCCKERGYLL